MIGLTEPMATMQTVIELAAKLDYQRITPLLQERWHISLSFITTGPGAHLAIPGNVKLLNRSLHF